MDIDGRTQLVGLIGWPVGHSFSPAMHNAALESLGLNWRYVPLPVHADRVGDALRGLVALGFRGANVTVPHKQAVMPFLDHIAPPAAAIGAVNTISVDGAGLRGTNSDWRGFLADLESLGVPVSGRDCLVLGAGGSARAVVYALAQRDSDIHVLARRVEQAHELVQGLGLQNEAKIGPLEGLADICAGLRAPLIVNTTPLGMSPAVGQSIWPDQVAFPAGSFVYDLVYNPAQTRLMHQAEAAGCAASNGIGMLLHQGALALALWTGAEPDIQVMYEALRTALGGSL